MKTVELANSALMYEVEQVEAERLVAGMVIYVYPNEDEPFLACVSGVEAEADVRDEGSTIMLVFVETVGHNDEGLLVRRYVIWAVPDTEFPVVASVPVGPAPPKEQD